MFWGVTVSLSPSSHNKLVRFDKNEIKDGIKTSLLVNAAGVSGCDRDSVAKKVSICSLIALNCLKVGDVLS